MKIEKLDLSHLRADAHFEFMTDAGEAVKAAGPAELKVKTQYDALRAALSQEDAVLKKIARSVLTTQIAEADHARDGVFGGMRDAVRSARRHYDPARKAAAERLWNVLHTYGNVAARAHDEETSAIYNLLKELTEKHADDLDALDLAGWVGALDKANIAVQKLSAERFEETAGRLDTTLRQARETVDGAYETLTVCVYALSLMAAPGEAAGYEALIRRLNAIVEHYATILAQQAGRRAAEKAREQAAKKAAETKE